MARKKNRTVESDTMLTVIFVGLLIVSALAGILGQFAHTGVAQ